MYRVRVLGYALILALLLTIGANVSPARAQTVPATASNGAAQITSPGEGTVIFGVVSIVGTAASPALISYQIQWLASADPRGQWQTIVGPISQQVNGAILGQWDTTSVSDGAYQLRLRLTLRDNSTVDTYIQHITVSNQQPTALPSAVGAPIPTAIPTAGPSPTSLIQQPPTATVNPTFAALAANASTTNNNGQFGVDLSGVPVFSALAIGIIGALGLFAVGMLYTWLRRQRRMSRKRRRSVR